jgi:hypothetical protein
MAGLRPTPHFAERETLPKTANLTRSGSVGEADGDAAVQAAKDEAQRATADGGLQAAERPAHGRAEGD